MMFYDMVKKNTVKEVLIEGNKISGDKDIADKFNKHFSVVGSSIVNSFTSTNNCVKFLSENLNHENFSFYDVSLEELTDIVSDLK